MVAAAGAVRAVVLVLVLACSVRACVCVCVSLLLPAARLLPLLLMMKVRAGRFPVLEERRLFWYPPEGPKAMPERAFKSKRLARALAAETGTVVEAGAAGQGQLCSSRRLEK